MNEYMEELDSSVVEKIIERYDIVLGEKKRDDGSVGAKSVHFYEDMHLMDIIPVIHWNNAYGLKEPYWSYVRTLQFKMRKELGEKIKRKPPMAMRKELEKVDTSKPWGSFNPTIKKIVR